MPKVSVCIPTFNQTKYLKKVLDSVFEQTYTDFEVIISDDSTIPLVRELVDTYKGFSQTINYFHHSPPLGSPENWNFAIKQAKGEYVKIMHHDDYFNSNDSLEKFVFMLDNTSYDFAFCSSLVVFEDDKTLLYSINDEQFNELKINPYCLFLRNYIGTPSATIFRFKPELLFDDKMKWNVDIDYYISYLSIYSKITFNNNPLIKIGLGNHNLTHECLTDKNLLIFENFYLYDKIKNKIKNKIKYINKLTDLLLKYNIDSINQIRMTGYNGHIPRQIYYYLIRKKIKLI